MGTNIQIFNISNFLSGISLTESQLRIPDELKECYVNNNMQDFHLPMNMRVLLDIIRKAETYSHATMDIRTMSSSLMHRYEDANHVCKYFVCVVNVHVLEIIELQILKYFRISI